MNDRNCIDCVNRDPDGCRVWDCDYIPRPDAIKAYKGTTPAHWVNETDNGAEMMACSNCGCRVIKKPYLLAVGTSANRCPYCGAVMEKRNTESI